MHHLLPQFLLIHHIFDFNNSFLFILLSSPILSRTYVKISSFSFLWFSTICLAWQFRLITKSRMYLLIYCKLKEDLMQDMQMLHSSSKRCPDIPSVRFEFWAASWNYIFCLWSSDSRTIVTISSLLLDSCVTINWWEYLIRIGNLFEIKYCQEHRLQCSGRICWRGW